MRVTDQYLQQTFLSNVQRSKKNLSDIQNQIASQQNISKASDNPVGAARVSRLQNQLDDIKNYSDTISNSTMFLDTTISTLQGMQTDVQNVVVNLTELKNPINQDSMSSYAEKIDQVLNSIRNSANTEVNGKYIFAGTNTNAEPYDLDFTNWKSINGNDLSGEQKVRIARNIDQKINMTGDEIFSSIVKVGGNLNSSDVVGSVVQKTQKILSADGKEFTLKMSYTKTAANTYDLSYDVTDSNSDSVLSGTHQLTFNAATGVLSTLDGTSPKKLLVESSSQKLSFFIDPAALQEKDQTAALTSSINQQSDIFNVLSQIKQDLLAGKTPSDTQIKIVNDFNDFLLGKITEAGGYSNRIQATQDMLTQEEQNLTGLLSKDKDVDVAKAVIDMQSAQYTLDLMYKSSSMLLPKSLMDYL